MTDRVAAHPGAGKPAPVSALVDLERLRAAYFDDQPDPAVPAQAVSFGTSGHRGSSLARSFNEAHILAVTQAICEFRAGRGITGPLFLGKDTHALSEPAEATALEVLAANGVQTVIQQAHGVTGHAFVPTPAISHAILRHGTNSDGIVVTPSHNPPEDGGFKYNPPTGGPADTDITGWLEKRANELLRAGNRDVKRWPVARARAAATTAVADLVAPYVDDLDAVIDMAAIRDAGLRIGADPLGGAAVAYWPAIAERWRLDLRVVNATVDPRFAFMPLDHDGKIRMDCSSPAAMANLVRLKDDFAIAFGNDADADRHGIVAPSVGLLNPNHFLAVAIDYLCQHRPQWPAGAVIGKTLVSSSLIDKVARARGRTVSEVPVGFKWFVAGLLDGSMAFGGEESAGASFLRKNGRVWTTDKDGILLGLLAAEITARTGRDPGQYHQGLVAEHGSSVYVRLDQPASAEVRTALKKLSPNAVTSANLAGDPITAKLVTAPGNGAPLGGLKVATDHGWFAARPSGTEAIYKIYAESWRGQPHLDRIVREAREIVDRAAAG